MKNIMNFCFGLKRAENVDGEASMDYVRDNVLNMDTSSPEGLMFLFASQIVNSNKVDVIVSNYFLSGSALFTDRHAGRTFTTLRHPVDVALSLFHYRRKATWERAYRGDWLKISFHEYVESDDYMDSWMVRQLTGTMPWVPLDESHLERAKRVMKEKIFVGILEHMDETVRQLKAHSGWRETTPGCSRDHLHSTPTNKNEHPGLQGGRGGKVWNLLMEKEEWDLGLYRYGLELFAEQGKRYPPQLPPEDVADDGQRPQVPPEERPHVEADAGAMDEGVDLLSEDPFGNGSRNFRSQAPLHLFTDEEKAQLAK